MGPFFGREMLSCREPPPPLREIPVLFFLAAVQQPVVVCEPPPSPSSTVRLSDSAEKGRFSCVATSVRKRMESFTGTLRPSVFRSFEDDPKHPVIPTQKIREPPFIVLGRDLLLRPKVKGWQTSKVGTPHDAPLSRGKAHP